MGSTRLSLLDLPLILFQRILYLLFEEDHDAFLATRLVSSACNNCSDRLFFRSIVLSGRHRIEEQILLRFSRNSDELAKHVRHIEFKPISAMILTVMIEATRTGWTQLSNLQSLSWNTYLDIPQTLLDLVHTRPSLRLLVENSARKQPQMDTSVLSSPNLYSLDYTVYHSRIKEGYISEFARLTSCLVKAKNLKILRLQTHENTYTTAHDNFSKSPLNLQFQEGVQFPALEELALDCADEYDYSPGHCLSWPQCMDLSRLRSLDLGRGAPPYLLAALTGHVPQLKSLSLSFMRTYDFTPKSRCPNTETIKLFLASIDGLTHIRIWSVDDRECRQIRPLLLAKHGQTLEHIDIDLGFRDAWDDDDLADLAERASNLRSLSTTIKMFEEKPFEPTQDYPTHIHVESSWLLKLRKIRLGRRAELNVAQGSSRAPSFQASKSCWPKHVERTLAQLKKLRELSLNVQLRHDSYQYVRDTHRGGQSLIDEKAAIKTVTSLFNDFGKGAAIEKVVVAFHATYPGEKIWTYTALKKWNVKKQGYKLEVESKEEGRDYDPSGFDPFKP